MEANAGAFSLFQIDTGEEREGRFVNLVIWPAAIRVCAVCALHGRREHSTP